MQAEIERLEARMDELRDRIESCRKAIMLSRLAVALAAALIIALLIGLTRSTPMLLLAIASALAGFVGMGSNRTTAELARAELATCRAARDGLIDALAPRVLG
ncbi:MAG TPA: hypothetical protein P5256_11245 [Beijerinckiaceae bacterium]|nr:hypothetical protein [Beijerinckiaceae bacterium]